MYMCVIEIDNYCRHNSRKLTAFWNHSKCFYCCLTDFLCNVDNRYEHINVHDELSSSIL